MNNTRSIGKVRTYTHDEIKNEFIGRRGTAEREAYEFALSLETLGTMIRTTRLQRGLSQAQLGALVGVQKAQISKLEQSARNVTVDSLLKVFGAMNATVNFRVELRRVGKRVRK